MPRNKDFKRLVRARMKKTGESYTTARSHLVSRSHQPPRPSARPAASPDYSALSGMRDEKMAAKTGRSWQEWVDLLDREGAASMTHGDIARLAQRHGAGNWWTQMVTVGYERIKGLRARGQRRGGLFEATKSRTFTVSVTRLFDAWARPSLRRRWLDDLDVRVRTATRPKSMRLQWPDGTIVAAWFMSQGASKSTVAIAHTKLRDVAAVDAAKRSWTDRLDALRQLFGEG